MTEPVGLDPERMAMLATRFTHASNDIEAARIAVHAAVSRAWWSGALADRFRTQWSGQLGPRLGACSQLLAREGTIVRTQLEQQLVASDSGTSFMMWTETGGSFGFGGQGGSGAVIGALAGMAAATLMGKPLLSGTRTGSVGFQAGNTGPFNVAGQPGSYGWGVSAGGQWQASGSVGFSEGQLGAHGQIGGFAGIEGHANATTTVGHGMLATTVGASGSAALGVRGSMNGDVKVGADGVVAEAGADVFAGVEANAEAHASALGATGLVGAGVSAGIGAHGHATAAVSLEKVKVGFDVGASLGVGLNLKVEVEIHPAETAHKIWKGLFG